MNAYHQEILRELKKRSRSLPTHIDLNHYLGSSHFLYSVTVPECRKIASEWVKKHAGISEKGFFELLKSLYSGQSHEEKTMPSKLLDGFPKFRERVTPQMVDEWLEHLEGWAEVDSLCQGTFAAVQFFNNWNQWQKALIDFSKDTNIHKRRASLVLLTSPVRQNDDTRLADVAFANIDRLKHEKDILITKAISWLLRGLIRYHRDLVETFIKSNTNTLPKIAVREVTNKLKTGRK